MQDNTGYFYYRRYSPWIVNKTPTLHWGQATMLAHWRGCKILSRLGTFSPMKKRILIIVESLPVPFDTRVWKEASVSLRRRVSGNRPLPQGQGIHQGT